MSSQRIDYYDSPEAPRANSLVPAVNVVAVNDAGEILLIRRTDNGNWALPGGAVDLGESVAQAAARETLDVPSPIPIVSGANLVKALQRAGFSVERVNGSHHVRQHPVAQPPPSSSRSSS
jgi:hypothetical protein